MSAADLLELTSLGGVGPGDFVLMEGTDVEITVDQFLAMAREGTLPGSAGSAPVAPSRLPSAPPMANSLPDWLADVVQPDLTRQSRVPGAPAWLEDIRQIEESLRRNPRPGADAPHPAKPSDAPPLIRAPAAPTTPPMPPPFRPSESRGYDAETGQILDPVVYARWQKAEAERRHKESQQQPPASVAEVFLHAQRAIQEWVDAEANKSLVTSGNEAWIRNCPSVKELMRRYEPYGRVMQEKLWRRLLFLVDNRKKYYQATR